jgi:penicillin-binding protein 2
MAFLQDNREYIRRIGWLGWLFSVLILVLFCRLWYLSIVRYDHFVSLANRNQIRSVSLIAPRGEIYDREGTILVENTFGFDLLLFPDQVIDPKETQAYLKDAITFSAEKFYERLDAGRSYGRYQPVVLKQNLSLAQMSYLLARSSDHPELEILERPRRSYVYGNLAAHLFGYMGEISASELSLDIFRERRAGDLVGKSGIERIYDADLSGRNGIQKLRVDSRGRTVALLPPVPAQSGQPIRLTIDLDLQKATERALEGQVGGAIAMDPRNGEILAIASHPTFDPNDFSTRISLSKWENLTSNSDKPLQNRVVQNTFSPGSIFKIVMALAGLEEGVLDPKEKVLCSGSKEFFGRRFRCSSKSGHGRLDLRRALQYSCNIYFYELGRRLGIDKIAAFSRKIGLGETTGVDLPGEVPGIVPSREWKKKTTGMPWFAGETISVSIGQGPVLVTPLQVALVLTAISRGQLVRPHIRMDRNAHDVQSFPREHLKPIRDGLWLSVNDSGTGRAAHIDGMEVAGKTGTVQTISRETLDKLPSGQAARFKPNAWFAGFAPMDDPRIVVAVIIERGGDGGRVAAPVARTIFQAYTQKFLKAPGSRQLAAGQ